LIVNIVGVYDIDPKDGKTSDPFVKLTLGKKSERTKHYNKCLSCEFNEIKMFTISYDYME